MENISTKRFAAFKKFVSQVYSDILSISKTIVTKTFIEEWKAYSSKILKHRLTKPIITNNIQLPIHDIHLEQDLDRLHFDLRLCCGVVVSL